MLCFRSPCFSYEIMLPPDKMLELITGDRVCCWGQDRHFLVEESLAQGLKMAGIGTCDLGRMFSARSQARKVGGPG